jgi:hypothetical protein
VTYFRQPGMKAAIRSAYRALKHLPESPATLQQVFDIRMELRPWLVLLADYERILSSIYPFKGQGCDHGVRQLRS